LSTPTDFSALQSACQEGQIDRVRELLDQGVDQNTDPGMPRGMTPLMLAAWQGHDEIVRLLVDRGAKIDYQDGDGFTAITLAAGEDFWKVVEFLAARGADVTHVDASGISALIAADRSHKTELVAILRKAAERPK
jgi:ankyrin repeat protein